MRSELPFTKQNRPWLTSECLKEMNEAFTACMSEISPKYRDALWEWALVKTEMEACLDQPEVIERYKRWGSRLVQEQLKNNL